MKCLIQGKVNGKRKRGRPKTSHNSNITEWMSETWSKSRGTHKIALNGEDWYDVQHGRLIITRDGTAKEESHCTGLFGFGYPGISIQ